MHVVPQLPFPLPEAQRVWFFGNPSNHDFSIHLCYQKKCLGQELPLSRLVNPTLLLGGNLLDGLRPEAELHPAPPYS